MLADLLPTVLGAVPPGGRVIAHEQNRLPPGLHPTPDHSEVHRDAERLPRVMRSIVEALAEAPPPAH